MSGSIFIDTNIAIYLLNGNEQIADLLDGKTVCVSFVTELELLSKPNLSSEENSHIRAFLGQCVVMDFFPSLKETIVEFRQTYRLKLPDAIVAATAFSLGLPLVTADRDFSRIKPLELILIEF